MVVGLGNPGAEYKGTRHNVGFEVIDLLAERCRIKLNKSRHQARYGMGYVGETAAILVKPLTYMNLSGRAISPLAKEHNIPPERILVIADDKDLVVGRVRLKPKGSAGGHNGHKNIIAALGTEEYPRLKIGIGSAQPGQLIDHVLGSFGRDERDLIHEAIRKAAEGAKVAVDSGLEAAMNVVNEPSGPKSEPD